MQLHPFGGVAAVLHSIVAENEIHPYPSASPHRCTPREQTAYYYSSYIEKHIVPGIGSIKLDNSIRTIPIPKQAVDLLILEHEKHPDSPYKGG